MTVWASIWPLKGRELLQAQQVVSEVTHGVTIRFRRGVTTAQRVKYVDHRADATRYFKIRSALNRKEKNQWLDLMCEELVDETVKNLLGG